MDEIALAIKTSFDMLIMATNRILDQKEFFMSNDDKSLAHTRWNCKVHIILAQKYQRKVIYRKLRASIGQIG